MTSYARARPPSALRPNHFPDQETPPTPPLAGFLFVLPGVWRKEKPRFTGSGVLDKDPGDDLLLHGLSHTTIGASVFHFRVRDGIGWYHSAVVTRERVEGRGFIDDESRTRSRLVAPTNGYCLFVAAKRWDVANGLKNAINVR